METKDQKLETLLSGHGLLCQHLSNLLQEVINTSASIDIRVHLGMSSPVGMHYQHARTGMRLLHHVGQMMPIVPAQRGSQNHQVERLPPQGAFHSLAAQR